MERFNVIITGQRLSGVSEEDALTNLAVLFKQSPESVRRLLGNKTTIKREIDAKMARRYLSSLTRAGLECDAELSINRDFFIKHWVVNTDEGEIKPDITDNTVTYELKTNQFTSPILNKPFREKITSFRGGQFDIVNHRWWIPPTPVLLITILVAPLIEHYLLLLGLNYLPGILLTLIGLTSFLALLLFMPTLFSIHRNVSIHSNGITEEPQLELKEVYSAHPFLKCYRITYKDWNGQLYCHRYRNNEARLYTTGGELIFHLSDNIDNTSLLNDISLNLRENVVGFGLLDKLYKLFEKLWSVINKTKTGSKKHSSKKQISVLDRENEVAAMVYKASTSAVIEIRNIDKNKNNFPTILLLALIGLGVY